MPKQRRWALKRQCDEAMRNIDKAIDLVVKVAQPYEQPHPELYDYLCTIVLTLNEAKNALDHFRDRI
jgi:hypothetical protein